MPVGQGSKRSIAPASTRTWIPDVSRPALIAAETSSSSLTRIRGAASNRVTRDPKALKIEATCTPVAPAPITSIEGGVEESSQASLWVLVNSKPGTSSRRDSPPVQMMIFSARSRGACSLSITCGSMNRAVAGVLVDGHLGFLELLAQQRVSAHVGGHLAHAIEQPRVVKRGFTGADAVARELLWPRASAEPREPASGPGPARRVPPFRRAHHA